MGDRPRWRGDRALDYGGATSCGCAARCPSSTRSPTRAPASCGTLLHDEDYVHALGALSGGQAVEMVKAGLRAIYLSGWQVAADANLSEEVYPDQSLYAGDERPGRRASRSTTPSGAPTRSSGPRALGRPMPRLARADRRRRRGGLRRRAQRLRADEEDDRRRRRRGALRGPALLGEEVRPHGRQGARTDRPARAARSMRRASPPT